MQVDISHNRCANQSGSYSRLLCTISFCKDLAGNQSMVSLSLLARPSKCAEILNVVRTTEDRQTQGMPVFAGNGIAYNEEPFSFWLSRG